MSALTLHAASVPVFAKTIGAISGWLDKAEAFAAAKKFDTSVLCTARLAPDMLPLTGQIHLATAFAKNAVCRFANQTPPDFPSLDNSFSAYRDRIAQTLEIVNNFNPADFAGADERIIDVKLPDRTMSFSGVDFLLGFTLPNLYFHATAAYAILRHNGVELGKMDFMGAPK